MSPETHETSDVPIGVDIREKGRGADGTPVMLDRRLFMQFLAFGNSADSAPLIQALEEARVSGASTKTPTIPAAWHWSS